MNPTPAFLLGVAITILFVVPLLLARPQRRIAVPDAVDVKVDNTAVLTAALVRKGWGFGGFVYVGGTVKLQNYSSSVFGVSNTTATTTAVAPFADFTISGLSVGSDVLQVVGSSAFGDHSYLFSSGPWVKINVRQ